jgi:thymidylate synthase ThyX
MVDSVDKLRDRVLENYYVTSATDSVYAVKSAVRPENFGAFGSFFSRNPRDLRDHLWDALTGRIKGFETDVPQASLERLANGEVEDPSNALSSGLKKSQEFFQRWYGKYSHKSIANTVWIPMVGTNMSQMVARELAYDQLAFFIEQSTRFVRFDTEHMYMDHDIQAADLQETYTGILEKLASTYRFITDQLITHHKQEIPLETWKGMQKEGAPVTEAAYNREIRGKSFDASRSLLPQATLTNIAWILDARSTEFDIAAWKGHPLAEVREVAILIENHAGQIAPSLLKYTARNDYYGRDLKGYEGYLPVIEPAKPFDKSVDFIGEGEYGMDTLNVLVANVLHRHNRGGTFSQRFQQVKGNMNFEEKIGVLKTMVEGRGSQDEWIAMDEEVDIGSVTFEIRSDLGAIRDWRRHQKWNRTEPLYTLDCGYYTPPEIVELGGKIERKFIEAMEQAHDAETDIRKVLPYQAQYIVPMAARHTITMNGGLDQLQYMINTRTTPQGHPSYREDAFNITAEAVRIFPWMLGYKTLPKGKTLEQLFEEAPLKGLLRPQFGDTALHK